MPTMNHAKYSAFPPVDLPDRNWPNQVISTAPVWCSVDLRDGNQALASSQWAFVKCVCLKRWLVWVLKKGKVGFPSASDTDFNFLRELIDGGPHSSGCNNTSSHASKRTSYR